MKILKNNLKKFLSIRIIVAAVIISIISLPAVALAAPGDWSSLHWVGSGYETVGTNVRAVQQICTDSGFGSTVGDIDGYYGINTKTALGYYQTQHHIGSDGIAGSGTWNVMHSGLLYGYTAYYQYGNDQVYSYQGGSLVFGYSSTSGRWGYETGDVDGSPVFTQLDYN
ncbi:MAG: peptidoglycan-binding domain-containing protein [Clostridium sp.]|uniref:peptidoglycan-binding domain-containing protein n=1 Tax=Clostridium sp. TaxID=1506 RepID=UPI0039EA322A